MPSPIKRLATGRIATTDDPEVTLATFTVPDETTWLFHAWVNAQEQSSTNTAGYLITGRVKRQSAGSAVIANVVAEITSEDDAIWDATADVSGNDLRIRVTGPPPGPTIDWTAYVELQGLE